MKILLLSVATFIVLAGCVQNIPKDFKEFTSKFNEAMDKSGDSSKRMERVKVILKNKWTGFNKVANSNSISDQEYYRSIIVSPFQYRRDYFKEYFNVIDELIYSGDIDSSVYGEILATVAGAFKWTCSEDIKELQDACVIGKWTCEGSVDVAKVLVSKGVDVNMKIDSDYVTPLLKALALCNVSLVTYLLEVGASTLDATLPMGTTRRTVITVRRLAKLCFEKYPEDIFTKEMLSKIDKARLKDIENSTDACEKGDLKKCTKLGIFEGLEGNTNDAKKHLKKSCDGGEVEGCGYLGCGYLGIINIGNIEEGGAEPCRMACDKGDARACITLKAIKNIIEKNNK